MALSCRVIIFLLPIWVFLTPFGVIAQEDLGEDIASSPYAVNLMSSVRKVDLGQIKISTEGNVTLYVATFEKAGRTWYRLRLGFFSDVAEARSMAKDLQSQYKGAWVSKVTLLERQSALEDGRQLGATTISTRPKEKDRKKPTPPKKTVKPVVALPPRIPAVIPSIPKPKKANTPKSTTIPRPRREPKIVERSISVVDKDIMAAKSEMIHENYGAAIVILEDIFERTDELYPREAKELYGLALERNGQSELAIDQYSEYLDKFPKGRGAKRVKQRLVSLQTATASPRRKLTAMEEENIGEFEVFGSFSQFSVRDVVTDDTGTNTVGSSLFNDFDLSGRFRNDRYDIRAQFNSSYSYDFEEDNGAPDDLRLSAMYISAKDRERDASISLGRQSYSAGGVLGRFDGLVGSYLYLPKWKVNVVAGSPVSLSSSNSDKSQRLFYGANVDIGTYKDFWDFNAFFIRQSVDSLTDRSAVGGEVRFTDDSRSFFTLLDYDTYFGRTNTLLFVGNWFRPNGVTFNLVMDYHLGPVLTLTNALTGQNESSIDDLNLILTEKEIKNLAKDRTAATRSFTLGSSKSINRNLQVSGDMTVSKQEGTPASAPSAGNPVPATPDSGEQYTYSVQVIGSNIYKEGDVSIIGLRYSDTDIDTTTSFTFNSRYPLTRAWRANPRFEVNLREGSDGSDRLTVKPAVRIDYRWKKNITYDIEVGSQWSDDRTPGGTTDSDYTFELGYRYDFED